MTRGIIRALGCLLLALAHPALAQGTSDSVDALARDVGRLESLRAVKNVQRSYAQYGQFGLWAEMADLFARDGKIVWGDKELAGRTAIIEWLQERGGPEGLLPGALHTLLIDDPLANLSIDGSSATARWRHFGLHADGRGGTAIEGGMFVNDYVLEGGWWKIATLRYFPQFEGTYREGWSNAGSGVLRSVPYHYDPDTAGVPIPLAQGRAPASGASLASLQARIAALNEEDAVRNLQHAYGYYVDRRMWDDVVDLFVENGLIEIVGVGTFRGRAGVRRALELMGPAGLGYGELNDRPEFDTIVSVRPGGAEAFARGIELGMTGDVRNARAGWEIGVFHNRFVNQGGIWKVLEMRIQPLVRADYKSGWGLGGAGSSPLASVLPFLGPNPSTGREVSLPGHAVLADTTLTGPIDALVPGETGLADLRRRYMRSLAYEGTANVSAAYGYYLGDSQWDAMSRLFATRGNKQSPFAGYYMGRERIAGAATARYGPTSARPAERTSGVYHWRPQPVILVSHDGRSATLRARLFQLRTSKVDRAAGEPNPNAINTGMYPNDQAVLEDGIWRLWSITIDEHYFRSPDWQGGWIAAVPAPAGERPPPSPIVATYPPDVLLTDLGRREEGFRGGTGETITWPGILPMWFHYRNLVSGRTAENYWPDCVPCGMMPHASMISHGYQLPPTGPQQDGEPIR